jgi:hypothetical protein
MRLLDWMQQPHRDQSDTEAQSSRWRTVGVHFYGHDGRYPPATWADSPERFAEMIPQIRKHLDNKLEVRITNSEDHPLFHATSNGVEWDGLRLSEYLSKEPHSPGTAKTELGRPKGKHPQRVSRAIDKGIER